MYRPLWIEIDLRNLKKNVCAVRKRVGSRVKILATIKQNAYGHGFVPVAQRLSALGVDFFGIGSLEEAVALKDNKINVPALVLTSLLPEHAEKIIDCGVRPAIADLECAQLLNKVARKRKVRVPVHIKVDTGMGRIGIWHEHIEKFVCEVKSLKNLFLEGIFTHFPVADTDAAFTKRQIALFNQLIKQLNEKGIYFTYIHCANSVALARYRQAHFNLVRPGLILYGIKPHHTVNLNLKPLLSLKSKVIFLKKVGKDRSIGYGRTYITKKPTTIATIAIGYADGYLWSASNAARVIIKDKLYRVSGRVCMDHIMVDVGSSSLVKKGDKVILIGKEKHARITAEDLARWAHTIPYEVVSRLSPNIPRIYK